MNTSMMRIGTRVPVLVVFLMALFVSGCGGKREYPPYSPHENLLSIASEFQLLTAKDPYADPPGRGLTGQSIARSTLVRLANYEALHPGRLSPEVMMLKGRALELLGEFESARRVYTDAATYDTPLKAEGNRRIEELSRLLVAASALPTDRDLQGVVKHLASASTDFRRLSDGTKDPFYKSLALIECEQADVRRAELIATNRNLFPDGDRQAVEALEGLITAHKDSRRTLEHALRLAHFHRELAEEEMRLNPPERSGFAAERFKLHYDTAAELLYRISQADGQPERLTAQHELDALLTFGEEAAKRQR